VVTQLHQTCDTIFDDYRDGLSEHWKDAVLTQENPKDFTFPTYDAWLTDYRRKSLPNGVIYADDWVLNTTNIAKSSKHTGYFNTEQDSDGTIRSKALVVRSGNSYFPSLSLKTFLVANNFNASPKLEFNSACLPDGCKEIADLEITSNETGNPVMHIPVDRKGRLQINYAGPEKMFPYMSYADLLNDSPTAEITQRVWVPASKSWEIRNSTVNKAEFIRDKIFLSGATATGIYDLRVTPFQENFPGTETHLNALDNMLQKTFFHTWPDEAVYMPLALCALGLILSVALSQLGAIPGLLVVVISVFGITFYDQHYLFNKGIVVSIIWPLFLIFSLYITLTFYRYLTEERGKKELRQTFQKYVSPAIVEEILAHPANIELGGRKAKLTVFFSDVRGFTTISEQLGPKALSDLLNSYLTPMTEIVFKNRGTLDKYMGDAVMAFFGAPIAYNDHAKWACRCALQSLEKLFELQKEYEKKGLPTIDIGIGLNTGEVNVGNMGSQTVRSYTVMGDAVNLASRLEGINKEYGTRIILSEFTYNEVKDSFVCREVDWVRVKGKILPVKIFELIAENKVPEKLQEPMKWFQQGYEHYHAKGWAAAIEAFSKALDLNPADSVARRYVLRCQDYLTHPPSDDWDGVFVMKTK
jgi:adenylate cyclase